MPGVDIPAAPPAQVAVAEAAPSTSGDGGAAASNPPATSAGTGTAAAANAPVASATGDAVLDRDPTAPREGAGSATAAAANPAAATPPNLRLGAQAVDTGRVSAPDFVAAGVELSMPVGTTLEGLLPTMSTVPSDTLSDSALPWQGRAQVAARQLAIEQALDQVQAQMAESTQGTEVLQASSAMLSAGFSAGYVLWLVRGGALLASLASALPAWSMVDPLPILAQARRGKGKPGDTPGGTAQGAADDERVEALFAAAPDDAAADARGAGDARLTLPKAAQARHEA